MRLIDRLRRFPLVKKIFWQISFFEIFFCETCNSSKIELNYEYSDDGVENWISCERILVDHFGESMS